MLVCQAGKRCRTRHPGKRLPASLFTKPGRKQNNLIIQPLHSLKVQHIYSYKLILNRLYIGFLFFRVLSPNRPVPLSISSDQHSHEGCPSASWLLQLVCVFTLYVSVLRVVGSQEQQDCCTLVVSEGKEEHGQLDFLS